MNQHIEQADVTYTQLYLAGQYRAGAAGRSEDIYSPVTGEKIASVALPETADLDIAVSAARTAQTEWERKTVYERAEILHTVGDLISARRQKLAWLLTLEQGKPLEQSYIDVDETAKLFHVHAEDALRLHGETLPSKDPNKRIQTFYRAVGTWGLIIPWNFPLLMWAEFVAPGLAVGNAWIVKPPTHTTLSLLEAVSVLEEAGLPNGIMSILPGDPEFGKNLVTHSGIDAIGFIGSSATAERIIQSAGLKRTIIEASGNGPVIVLDDADIEAAARAAVEGAYFNAGQVCVATGRVLVQKAVHESFVAAVQRVAAEIQLGDPFAADTNLGPVNNPGVAAKVDGFLAEAQTRGFDVIRKGGAVTGFPTDLYYDLAIIDNVTEESSLHQEEIFGPILPIIPIDSDEELLRVANSDSLGLQAALFTSSLSRAYSFAENLRAGSVIINDSNGYWDLNMPFGGAAGSKTGWGRLGGKFALIDMSDIRCTIFDVK